MFSNLLQFVKDKEGCDEGFEYKANPMPCIFPPCPGPKFGCFPISQNSTSTTTTTTTTLESTSVPPIPGGYEAQLKAYKDMESKSTPTLPSGEKAIVTNKDNTQFYILYGILGVAIITLLIKNK